LFSVLAAIYCTYTTWSHPLASKYLLATFCSPPTCSGIIYYNTIIIFAIIIVAIITSSDLVLIWMDLLFW